MSESASSQTSPKCVKIQIPKVVTWSDPLLSASVLFQALAVILAVKYLHLVFKYLSYGLFLLSVTELGTRAIFGGSRGLVSQQKLSQYFPINQKCIEKFAFNVERFLKCASQSSMTLIDVSCPIFSIATATTLFLASFAIKYFHPLTLITVVLSLSFTVPPIYLAFRPEIENCAAHLQKQTCGAVCCAKSTVCKAVSPHIATLNKKVPFIGESLKRVRGGCPMSPNPSQPNPTMTEIPGPAANPHPEPVVKTPKVSETSKESLSSSTPDEPAAKKTTSVPTLIGNVEVDEAYTKLVDEAVEAAQKSK